MTNLVHLNVVATICDLSSFQLASEMRSKARSAVSYSVKQVEELYQIQIFDRSGHRPTLTRDGRVLLTQIRHLLASGGAFRTTKSVAGSPHFAHAHNPRAGAWVIVKQGCQLLCHCTGQLFHISDGHRAVIVAGHVVANPNCQ
ncbi:regulatory helix-turn-helix protein, lysR family [Shimia sagamensis]|uniref:Regulatory helix-turn-helix protein, lysR family n=1 Tax=Shimia sagamensis TaxID=1566352 RepID=A0ABY1NYX0_9RHOB|nr:regulatory helix-turn-helix protein, lysR family [Shimia sagamensis]